MSEPVPYADLRARYHPWLPASEHIHAIRDLVEQPDGTRILLVQLTLPPEVTRR